MTFVAVPWRFSSPCFLPLMPIFSSIYECVLEQSKIGDRRTSPGDARKVTKSNMFQVLYNL